MFSPIRFSQYTRDLSAAIRKLSLEHQFDTRKISRADLTKALDRGDVDAGSPNRHVSWDGQIMKVDWVSESKPMPTIAEQLKAARAQLAEARKAAADAVTESADASRVVMQEVEKARKEAADLRAEVAELTNGAPI